MSIKDLRFVLRPIWICSIIDMDTSWALYQSHLCLIIIIYGNMHIVKIFIYQIYMNMIRYTH